MKNHQLYSPKARVRPFHPTSAEEIIVRCQDILSLAPHPDSSDRAVRLVNALREVLDSPEALEIYENVAARRSGGYRGLAPLTAVIRRFVG